MAPWSQIARPFSFYFAINCVKTVVGAGLVGYGFALAVVEDGDDSDKPKDAEAETTDNNTDTENNCSDHNDQDDPSSLIVRKYIKIAATIGFGLFLSLPSLMSQIVWETMIPGITATDIMYDISTENVRGIIPRWDDIIKKPKLPGLGGLIGGKEGLQITASAAVDSVKNRGSH
eukprot:jgi/Psemu1/64893/estExt_Genemark1.C_900052